MELPSAVNLGDVTILGRSTVRLNDNVTVTRSDGGPTQIVNMGSVETNLGVQSQVMHVTSRARVVLMDRAKATGDVTSSSSVERLNGAAVSGTVLQNTMIPAQTLTLTVPVRGTSRGPVQLEPDASLRLEPGTYGPVHIKSRSTVQLRSGVYLLDSLFLEPDAKLALDDADGIVEIYLKSDFTFRGKVDTLSGAFPKLFIAATGTNQVTIDAPYRGSIAAPNARIALISTSVGHEGTFFGKEVEVQPGTPIRHNAPNWDAIINGPSLYTLRWNDGSAVLRAAEPADEDGVSDGHVALPQLIGFTMPKRIWVEQGNAGNYPAVFRYRDQQRNVVTCSYRGGSPVAAPTAPLDVARGLHYAFQGCSNGATAGSYALGNEFWLTIDAVVAPEAGFTAVELHLDGCGGKMEPTIEPEKAVEMVDAFSWQSTQPVPEYDSQGRPTLYYAMIYVEDHEQLGALDDAYIHWDQLPFFKDELEQFDGQCGTVRGAFDGEGQFVYALLPGVTYNQLRQYALSPELDPETGEEQTVFDVVILRTPPAVAANADGSVSYSALMDSAFKYLEMTDLPAVDDEQQQPRRKGKFRKFCRRIAKKVREAVRGTVRVVVTTLGAVDLALSKDHSLYLTMKVNNRDQLFPGEMKQGWGANRWDQTKPNAPWPRTIRPDGARVDIKMWGFGGPVPTLYSDHADVQGLVMMKVPRSDQVMGSAPRGKNPVCMHLDSSAAAITGYLFYDRVCDFGGDTSFAFRGSSSNATLTSNHSRIHMFNALTDANRYFTEVAGYSPHRVRVLTGWFANHANFPPWGEHPAFAGCMGLNKGDDVAPLLFNSIPSVGPLLSAAMVPLSQADIVMPDNRDRFRSSRGIIVHEYGHFALCSLLFNASPHLLSDFLKARIIAGKKIKAGDEVSVLSDAFADFVAEQVVGGVDYTTPSAIVQDKWGSISYFAVPGEPGMEGNATGSDQSGKFSQMPDGPMASAGGYLELARVGTIWHDVFDGHYWAGDDRDQNVPGNGDYHLSNGATPPLLTPTSRGWVSLSPGNTADDERVSLSTSLLPEWIDKWKDWPDFSIATAMLSLSATMADHEVTWCEACDLYVLHEEGVGQSFKDRWAACSQGRLWTYLGSAPDPWLNMELASCEACDPLHYTDANGACQPCGPGEIAIQWGCEACPAGTVPTQAGTCDACASDQISQGGQCVACGPAEHANKVSNTCDPCSDDLPPINWPAARATCQPTTIQLDAAASANDGCPDRLFIRLEGGDDGAAIVPTVSAGPGVYPPELSCAARSATLGVFSEQGTELAHAEVPQGTYDDGCDRACMPGQPDQCEVYCTRPPMCLWPTPVTLAGQETVRIMVTPPAGLTGKLTLTPSTYPTGCVNLPD